MDVSRTSMRYAEIIIVFSISFTTSFVGGIIWWTDGAIIIYSKSINTTTFESQKEGFFWVKTFLSPKLMPFDTNLN